LQSGRVVRVDFKLLSKNKVEMPSGNECRANEQWIARREVARRKHRSHYEN